MPRQHFPLRRHSRLSNSYVSSSPKPIPAIAPKLEEPPVDPKVEKNPTKEKMEKPQNNWKKIVIPDAIPDVGVLQAKSFSFP